MQTKLLVLSDLHLTGGKKIIGLDPLTRFQQTLKVAIADHPDAAALILLGDLAHHGDPVAYRQLRETLAATNIPAIPLIGNHDRRETYLDIFPETPLSEGGFLQRIVDFPGHRVITLDTLDGPPYPKGHHAGRLCDQRRDWLARQLDTLGDRMALVFAHHPPFKTGLPGMDAIRLTDGNRLISMLSNHNVHLFCGHIHRTISGTTGGVPWTVFKSTCHQAPLDLSTPDSSLSVDEPAAYGLILLQDDGVTVHTQDVGILYTRGHDSHSASL